MRIRAGKVLPAFLATLAVVASSCDYAGTFLDDDLGVERINHAYADRDTCLKWAILIVDDGTTTPREAGVRAASLCGTEIRALIAVSNPSGDPAVIRSIEADSAFRGWGYVVKSRHAATEVLSLGLAAQKR